MISGRRILILLLATAAIVALLALGWSAEAASVEDLLAALREARWWFLPAAGMMGLLVFPVKALRWRILLAPTKKVRFRPLFSAIMIGFMVNCIFSRIGEVVRAGFLGLRREVRTTTALASIALERIFDMCTVVLFLVIALLWLQPAPAADGARKLATIRVSGVLMGLMFAAAVAFLVLLRVRPKEMTRLVLGCVSWLPPRLRTHVEKFLASFLSGLNALKDIRQVAVLFGLSIIHWFLQVLYFLLVAYCLPQLHMSLPGAMLVFTITALGVAALPLPGYLGVYQAAVLAATAILSLPGAASFSYAWLCWAANIPPIILLGFVFLWAEGLSLREIRSGSSRR